MSEKPIREYDRFILRLPDGMRERLQQRAHASGKSMNGLVIDMLEQAMNNDGRERLENMVAKLESMKARRESLARGIQELEIQERVMETELAVLSTELAAIERTEQITRTAGEAVDRLAASSFATNRRASKSP